MIYGSIISGTHRVVDLAPVFLAVLEQLDPGAAWVIHEEYEDIINAIEEHSDILDIDIGEEGMFLIESLIDALNEFAPDGYYFGTNPYDGADYGFWAIDDDDDYDW